MHPKFHWHADPKLAAQAGHGVLGTVEGYEDWQVVGLRQRNPTKRSPNGSLYVVGVFAFATLRRGKEKKDIQVEVQPR